MLDEGLIFARYARNSREVITIKTIGLTGGIACGKSTVAQILNKHGLKTLNADKIAHEVIGPSKPAFSAILEEFGQGILDQSGVIDRIKLGKVVFKDTEARKKLESIIHPLVIEEIKQEIKSSQEKGINILIVEIPLLYETGLENLFDQVWVVSSSEEEQIKRLKSRGHLNEAAIKERLDSQLPISFKEDKADRVIYNNKGLGELEREIIQALRALE